VEVATGGVGRGMGDLVGGEVAPVTPGAAACGPTLARSRLWAIKVVRISRLGCGQAFPPCVCGRSVVLGLPWFPITIAAALDGGGRLLLRL
jgi:hypothetical protein